MLFRSILLTGAALVCMVQIAPVKAQQVSAVLPALVAEQHPFLEWGGMYPRWSRLTSQQGVKDIRLAIDRARQRIEAICQVKPEDATWENTFGSFEQLEREIGMAEALLYNIFSLMDNPEVRAAQAEITPVSAEFSSSISANERLWAVIRHASTCPWVRTLSAARQRYV